MKIYFDGCSWTYGSELSSYKESRFSKLISDHFGAEEHNFSFPGASNDRILRNAIVENNIEGYDLAVIQLTFPSRTEYYNMKLKEWKRMTAYARYDGNWLFKDAIKNHLLNNSVFLRDLNKDDINFWVYYYTNITNDVFFDTKEKIIYESIKSFFAHKNVPLVLITIDSFTKLDFTLNLSKKYYPTAKDMHPNEEGHKMIAKDILNIVKQQNLI
jgi:hypothetical protein